MVLINLFFTFLKIGAFTFGGGYAMLPLIRASIEENHWMDDDQIINFIAVSESTPGPFAINISTYVGMEAGGILGSVLATLGVVLPSFVIILIVARIYEKFKTNKYVQGAMGGLKPAVIGFIATAVLSTAITVFFPTGIKLEVMGTFAFISSVIIFVSMLILALKKVHPIIIIGISAGAGIAYGYLQPFIGWCGIT